MEARAELEKHNGVFVDRGCLFVSTTGLILTGYANCEVLYPHYQVTWDLTEQLIRPFLGEVECFVSPATGDIVLLEYATIMANQQGYETAAVWADKHDDNSYHIERNGYAAAVEGRRVLILNDRISQGGTTRKVIAEVRSKGGIVIGVSTLAGVSTLSAKSLDVPVLNALCNIDVQAFPYDELPPELANLPIVVDESLGHGADYQRITADNNPHPGGYIKLLSA